MDKATVESVMALAFELARIREQHGAQSGMYLSEVRALRAEAERLAAQAAPTEAEYNPLLIDGVQHDPLCLKVYRSPLKECDCGASSRAAQPSQAPVVLAVQVEPVAWLDTVIDWTATGQPITRRICIQAQCGDWALSYIESALRETASTVAALKAEIEALRKDAERYRWLRDGEIVADYPYPVMRMGGSRVDDQTIWADELDAAIDRAACCDGTEGGVCDGAGRAESGDAE